jgi:hypothetical protein
VRVASRAGTCDVWCEFALSFRTLATVLLYFAAREHRKELFNVRELFRRLRTRIATCIFAACPSLCCFGERYVRTAVSFSDRSSIKFLQETRFDDDDNDNTDDSYAAAIEG